MGLNGGGGEDAGHDLDGLCHVEPHVGHAVTGHTQDSRQKKPEFEDISMMGGFMNF